MAHGNAPLTPEGRRRLCERIDDGRPISHVADEAGVSRQRLSVWYQRWLAEGDAGLEDRSSKPAVSPNQTAEEIEDLIEVIRRDTKRGPDFISGLLAGEGILIAPATVHRVLVRRGINRRSTLDPPTGEDMREVIRYEHAAPGDMLHVDVKKVGKIPMGGGWRAHGRGSEQALRAQRKKNKRPGYTYLHAAIDDNTRIAYVECHDDEKAVTACEFLERAMIFFETHGITTIRRVLTDNGSCYVSHLWKALMKEHGIVHKRTRRQTPRTNGKVERFNRTMKDEWLYVAVYASEEERRAALVPFLNGYNHDRPHSAIGNRPPISRAPLPGQRLDGSLIVLPVREEGQLALDLLGDNNLPGEHT